MRPQRDAQRDAATRRHAYSAAFKLKVVREALQRPASNRIKPTCRDHPGIEPVQLRKWIRNLAALEEAVPSAKCIARPSRAAPPPRPQEEGYTSAEEGKPAGDVKDAGYNPAKATSYDAPRFAHPSPMRVAFANMHNAYGTAVASHWYAKPDAHVQQQVPPACGSFCNTMYPGPFCMPMQLHPVQLGPQMVQPHLQQPMTGMYVQPPIYGQIPAPTTSATYGQTMSPVSAAPYGLGAAPVSAASYAQASGSAVPYGQATAPVGTTSYGTHMPVNVAPFTQPRAVTCGSAIGPPMMPSCSQPELGSYPPPLVRPRPQQPMPVTMPICSQSVAPSHQPASVKTREEHNCAAQELLLLSCASPPAPNATS